MNRLSRFLALALAAVALAACSKKPEEKPAAAPIVLVAPTDGDSRAWREYITNVVRKHGSPDAQQNFTYFLSAEQAADEEVYGRQVDNVGGAIGRGVTAGTQLIFVSPNTEKMVELVEEAFQYAGAGSMNGVRVIFVGNPEHEARVREKVEPTGAELVFVELK